MDHDRESEQIQILTGIPFSGPFDNGISRDYCDFSDVPFRSLSFPFPRFTPFPFWSCWPAPPPPGGLNFSFPVERDSQRDAPREQRTQGKGLDLCVIQRVVDK